MSIRAILPICDISCADCRTDIDIRDGAYLTDIGYVCSGCLPDDEPLAVMDAPNTDDCLSPRPHVNCTGDESCTVDFCDNPVHGLGEFDPNVQKQMHETDARNYRNRAFTRVTRRKR